MIRLDLRFRHDCPFSRLSAAEPEVRINHWCNFRSEYVEVDAPDLATIRRVRSRLHSLSRREFRILRETTPDRRRISLALSCGHRRRGSVGELLDRHGAIILPPVTHFGGWESYRILVPEGRRIPSIAKDLGRAGQVELVRKRRIASERFSEVLPLSADLMIDLTRRQVRALLIAVDEGYYNVPRQVRMTDIAKRHGVPRTTFVEHVQKAEVKVVRAMAPYLSMTAPG
ncbi:MAG: helix-turn-helix domain-containing protein [Thermoplasmata archaeon]